ncbi:hypothetical protein TRIP_C60030 [Candidatus Zixiibacteriota bacterium]|nr:hypothetical protein TRIP_C60030 [candidate division Zixibacteria bacterium]
MVSAKIISQIPFFYCGNYAVIRFVTITYRYYVIKFCICHCYE